MSIFMIFYKCFGKKKITQVLGLITHPLGPGVNSGNNNKAMQRPVHSQLLADSVLQQ
jgi:hypothetical protein